MRVVLNIIIGSLSAGALACMPAANLPGVLEPLDSPKWQQCADDLAARSEVAMIDDIALRSETLICQGMAIFNEGNVDVALDRLNEAGVKDKKDHRPLYLSGRILVEARRYEEALTAFEKSWRRYPAMEVPSERIGRTIKDVEIPGNETAVSFLKHAIERKLCPYGCKGLLAEIYHETGMKTEAGQIYEEMIFDNPDEPAAYVGLARMRNSIEDFWGEAEQLERALKCGKFKELTIKEQADLYYSQAFAWYNAKELNAALDSIKKGIELDAKNADWFVLNGWVELKRDNAAQALIAFDKAMALNPNLAVAHAGIGDAQLLLGSLEKAVESYDQAHQLDSHDPVIKLKRGFAAAKSGDLDTAELMLEGAERLGGARLPADLVAKVLEVMPKYRVPRSMRAREQEKQSEAAGSGTSPKNNTGTNSKTGKKAEAEPAI
jgi:tetratricopeptide (TPR) repeat protein